MPFDTAPDCCPVERLDESPATHSRTQRTSSNLLLEPVQLGESMNCYTQEAEPFRTLYRGFVIRTYEPYRVDYVPHSKGSVLWDDVEELKRALQARVDALAPNGMPYDIAGYVEKVELARVAT